MIEDLVIITNSQLKIENINSENYKVANLVKQRYQEFITNRMIRESSVASATPSNLNIPPGHRSKTLGVAPKGSIHTSIKNLIFNVNSELPLEGDGIRTG